MKILNFDKFNEELDLKKVIASGLLASGLALSNPSYSQTINRDLPVRVDKEYIKIKKIGELKIDSVVGYERNLNGKWKSIDPDSRGTIYLGNSTIWGDLITYSFTYENKDYVILNVCDNFFITYKNLFDSIDISSNKKIVVPFNQLSKLSHEDIEESILYYLKNLKGRNLFQKSLISDELVFGGFKLSILFGESIMRFRFGNSYGEKTDDLENSYMECQVSNFKKLLSE